MKIVRTLAVLVAAVVLLLASGAPAQAAAQYLPGYSALMGGVYLPEGDDLDEADTDNGWIGLVTFGYQMNPFVGLQTDLGYMEIAGSANVDVSAIPVAVSVKLGIPIAFFEPYVLGGAGVYFASMDWGNIDDNSVEFALHGSAGANLNFGKFQIGAEARYIMLEVNGRDVDGVLVMGKLGARF